ncbi:MAG: 8-amino-7-oxononanoate synthase [Lentisphaeria bacterium]|nr:8-amino-7-oxononanoate synthase [Lentisphaeria bacterium]
MTPFEKKLKERLDKREIQKLKRQIIKQKIYSSTEIEIDGKRCINFSSNDYLGLAQQTYQAQSQIGGGASRLVTGNHQAIQNLEKWLEKFYGHGLKALVFGSGYLANLGVISGIVSRGDLVFSDKLNHASIIDGAILSGAKHIRYNHLDYQHLEALLEKHKEIPNKLIVSDATFSMNGDCADLAELVRLKKKYDCILLVDEAHSAGVLGPQGKGLAHSLGIQGGVDIHLGTFSKAYGAYGAYVMTNPLMKEYLINFARTAIYSTVLPPIICEAILQNLRKAKSMDKQRQNLISTSLYFKEKLIQQGWDIGLSETQIVPVILKCSKKALILSKYLNQHGFAGIPIRPPTVQNNEARIRFSLNVDHSKDHLDPLLDVLQKFLKEEI